MEWSVGVYYLRLGYSRRLGLLAELSVILATGLGVSISWAQYGRKISMVIQRFANQGRRGMALSCERER
jgi:hypothetical protein